MKSQQPLSSRPPTQVSHLEQPKTLSSLSQLSPFSPPAGPQGHQASPGNVYGGILPRHKSMWSLAPPFPTSTLNLAVSGSFSGLSNGGVSGPVATAEQSWGGSPCSLNVEAFSWEGVALFSDWFHLLPATGSLTSLFAPHQGFSLLGGQLRDPHLQG